MSNLERISITLPSGVLAAADREAKRLDRSRSWVVAEAVRRYVGAPAAVREAAAAPYGITAPGLGSQRRAQLQADLALTPEQRVQEAEQTARDAEVARGRKRSAGRLLFFDRFQDYIDWKQHEELEP